MTTITDDRQREALQTLRACCEKARNSSALTLLWFVARPLATDFADLNAWAERRALKSPSGHDFGFWMAMGINFRQRRTQTFAGTLVDLANLLRHLEAAGLRQACASANLYADDRQGGIVQIGDASGRAYVEAVAILAERWLRSAGVWDVDELPDDNEAAAAMLAEELLKPVWHNGREMPKGVRVAMKAMASLGELDTDAIKLVLDSEYARIGRDLSTHLGPPRSTVDGFNFRDEHLTILAQLVEMDKLVKVSELDGLSGMPSYDTLTRRLRELEAGRFVARPNGDRSGYITTESGRAIAEARGLTKPRQVANKTRLASH